ncbi:unnamed protein product [Musa acuminata subsp. malaccensis]|uniref:(wild Malaysian banana) hypothetical protein n=1 Tax=Musa acuminata subsp. malaccensis TaxID=214687 RepID=A0A804IMD5_MUSAM|nr:unnamed protein product [Musa acuminata subsp. malaccensis]
MDPNSKDGTVLRKRPLSIRTGRKSGAHRSAEEESGGALNSEIMVVEDEPVSPLTRLSTSRASTAKPLDVYVVKSSLEATLVRHPRFSSMPSTPHVIDEAGGKKAKWVRTEVVVENHIPPSLATPWATPAPSGISTSSTSPPPTPPPFQCSASTTPLPRLQPQGLRPRLPSHNPQTLPPAAARLQEAPCGCFYGPLVAVDIKDVKNAMHCTVNDVLVGVTSAGFSRSLSRRYNQLPSNSRLHSTLLVNIRPIPGIHALAELTEGRDGETKWGNFIGYLILPFSIMRCKNPLDYIRRAKATADRKKNSLGAIFTYKGAELIVKCFGIKAAAALCHRVLSNTTLSISNMIGPVEEIVFYDHPLVYLALSVFGHPQALTVHFQSYVNTMKIVLTVDEAVIPDPY